MHATAPDDARVPGDAERPVPRRRVTIRDVARASFTSVATVSVALSGGAGVAAETRAHVQEVADRLGWRPNRYASNLRKTDSRLIGFVCEVEQVFQMGLVDSLYVAAQRKGLELVLAGATAHHDERTCVDESLRARCQAIILTGSGLTEAEMSELAGAVPLVSLCRLVHAPGVNVVVSAAGPPAHLLCRRWAGLSVGGKPLERLPVGHGRLWARRQCTGDRGREHRRRRGARRGTRARLQAVAHRGDLIQRRIGCSAGA